jgi:hypothetical protein
MENILIRLGIVHSIASRERATDLLFRISDFSGIEESIRAQDGVMNAEGLA